MRSHLILFLLFALSSAQAQDLPLFQVPFTVNGELLANPLAGGLNAPQFSSVDLNNDGTPDLYVFDRAGNKHLTFINDNPSGPPAYRYDPLYAKNFPPIQNWVLLRDFNGDGAMDIFAYPDVQVDGVMVYRGYYEDNQLKFARFNFTGAPLNIIFFPLNSGGQTQLYVSTIDYPAIDDLDCDGDLDILTFNAAGGYVELYCNRSVEMGFGRDSLIYRRCKTCWGGFYESGLSVEVDLATQQGGCFTNLDDDDDPVEFRHAGSTLLTLDMNNDGAKELVLGDLSFNELNLLHNAGSCSDPWINAQEHLTFPDPAMPFSVPTFPAAFHLDVNGDGKRDLIGSPNSRISAEDRTVAWYYENTGTEAFPQFTFRQDDFLVDQMLDFGTGAHPAFVDYNGDGLLDLVVGNVSTYKTFGAFDPRIFLFLNTGTAQAPAFELVDDDLLNMNQFAQSSYNFAPAFGDLDGDGDLDLLIGEQYGQLFYAENIAGAGQPMQFGPVIYGYKGINVGQASVPQIIDLNRDGLLDLVIGERNGNINFLPNIGTSTSPDFVGNTDTAPNIPFLGSIDTRIPGFSTGHSAPAIINLPNEGGYHLFTGSEIGQIERYNNIDDNIGSPFNTVTEQYASIREGARTRIAFADLNGDGLLELWVGNQRGGLSAFQTDLPADNSVATAPAPAAPALALSIFPNPTSGKAQLLLTGTAPVTGAQVDIYHVTGQLQQQLRFDGHRHELDLAQLPAGVYALVLTTANGHQLSQRIVKQ